jgi:carbon monoxide dehydrogenase subunit G
MNIEGTYTLQARPEEVWHCLQDKDLLLHTIAGLERFEQVSPDTYEIAMSIKHAPLTGTYHGRIHISEQLYPYYYHITITGIDNGKQNTISGNGDIHLNDRNGHTILTYTGDFLLNKQDSPLPPPVLKGGAKLLLQQFFASLSTALHQRTTRVTGASVRGQTAGDIIILPAAISPPAPADQQPRTFTLMLIRLLRLGSGDPDKEAQWTKRIQRIGIISGLLLLVWIGTRLPRRR